MVYAFVKAISPHYFNFKATLPMILKKKNATNQRIVTNKLRQMIP